MAVSREPILKRCKYLGISPMVMGVAKETKRDPNANKRKKVSEYGLQLKEKQKLKFIYGMLEKQFYHYFEIAQKMEGQAGANLITLCESRLDNVVFRMGLATTRREARQLVVHGHYNVNGRRVDIPSYRIKTGDVISLRDNSKKSEKFKQIIETTAGRLTPTWLDVNKDQQSAKVVRMPVKEDLDYEIEEHLIVELYSK
ncbi:30S ribosomal protein S4 [Ruminococcus sp. Marseille-P6503]|uniref:30S ribosomal protein S4 n=1 Tax=Ruminococcus sp. Marseille-P6503 TaxID=2364796 RepID=UPI000F54A93A|nr:30S ribosomal protein S4 [Ruminococcus sp. Marseille-P6503]